VIRLEVNNGMFVRDYEQSDVPTVGDLISKFQQDEMFRFANSPAIWDTANNRKPALDEETVDGRYYTMDVWVLHKIDSGGNPVTGLLT
jgi:hypothetical protein